MLAKDLHVGAVFQTDWDARPCRIVAFDETLVFYDSWLSEPPGWGLDSLKGAASYYCLPTPMVVQRAKYLRTEDYSVEEKLIHRPDLPLSFGRSESLEWPMFSPVTQEEFPDTLFHPSSDACSPVSLEASKIYLLPFGPKGGIKAPVLVRAKNRTSFSVEELLWLGAQHQFGYLGTTKLTTGVGLYRSGIKDNIPTYYIWGSKSRAGI